MIIEINDSTTPMLSAIARISRDVAFEHMSKIGNTVRKNAGIRMRSSRNRHNWFQRLGKNGKRVPYKDVGSTKELGRRTRLDGTSDNPNSMANMISSNLMEDSGTLVVGGRNARKYQTRRVDGEAVGFIKLDAITKHSQSIINKLDQGERNVYHGWGKKGLKTASMPNFRTAQYRRTNFMIKGFGDSAAYMKSELTSGYEKTVGRAVNKVQVRLKPSKRELAG